MAGKDQSAAIKSDGTIDRNESNSITRVRYDKKHLLKPLDQV